MAYVPVPKDLTRIKPKVMFNLTKRQLVCFGLGIAVGLPLFFVLKALTGVSAASLLMIFSMLPFFLFGMYEKDGQPLEKILGNFLQTLFLRPKQRPYKTNNLYAAIIRQHSLHKEVQAIVRKTQPHSRGKARGKKAHAQRKKENRSAHRQSEA